MIANPGPTFWNEPVPYQDQHANDPHHVKRRGRRNFRQKRIAARKKAAARARRREIAKLTKKRQRR
jgi:hypothetical protein